MILLNSFVFTNSVLNSVVILSNLADIKGNISRVGETYEIVNLTDPAEIP